MSEFSIIKSITSAHLTNIVLPLSFPTIENQM